MKHAGVSLPSNGDNGVMSAPNITRGWTHEDFTASPSAALLSPNKMDPGDRRCVLVWADDYDAMLKELETAEKLENKWWQLLGTPDFKESNKDLSDKTEDLAAIRAARNGRIRELKKTSARKISRQTRNI